METKTISRRDLLKSTGILVVSFSFFGPIAKVLAQGDGLSVDGMDPTVLDSWLTIAKDGSVTVFTGKVELGTGVITALAQIVAEELDVRYEKVYMDSGDTDKAVDQGVTAAARTIERGGVQLRQASAAARQELLKVASARLDYPRGKLTVTDRRGGRQVTVTWCEQRETRQSGQDDCFDYLKNRKSFKDNNVPSRGNPDSCLAEGAKVFEATYYWPFQWHGRRAPPCAVADVRGDKA